MTVAIVGGAGFVGLNVAEALLRKGRAVRIVDRGHVPAPALAAFAELPGRLETVQADVTDPAAMAAAIGPGTEALVYGATLTAGPAREASEPERILAVNLGGLVPTLRAAKAAGTRRVVLLNSVSGLGEAVFRDVPLDEGVPADPVGLYAITKFAAERVGARLGTLWDLDVRSVRLSSVYGPWERDTRVRDTLSPQFQIMQAAERGAPALLPPGGTRDWLYAPDAAEAVLALLHAPAPRFPLYNVTPGVPSSLGSWGAAIATLRPGFVCRPCEPGEAPTVNLYATRDRAPLSPARLRDDVGWVARFRAEDTPAHYDAWWRAHAGGLGAA